MTCSAVAIPGKSGNPIGLHNLLDMVGGRCSRALIPGRFDNYRIQPGYTLNKRYLVFFSLIYCMINVIYDTNELLTA